MLEKLAKPLQKTKQVPSETLFDMKIEFNGQPRDVPAGTTVAALLDELKLVPKHVAVEVNLSLVPREKHATQQLRDGDAVEVVTLVGGG